jgi:hypothetical protein
MREAAGGGRPTPPLPFRERGRLSAAPRRGLEAEGTPGVVETVRVGEPHVAAGGAVLGVDGLHPEDVFGDTNLSINGEAPHAAADAGEGRAVV